MNPVKLYFDVRDIFRAPRLALSGKKIWTFLYANLIGYTLYLILSYIALALDGSCLKTIWGAHGLFPNLCCASLPWYSTVLFWLGILLWFWAISFACTAVARITYKQLKGDEFFSSSDARAFVKKHWHPVIFTSISLLLIVVFFLVLALFAALLGKIPYVGEFLFVLPFVLYFFGSVFTIYTGIVFIMSIIYTPAIVAAYEEDTMGSVFQSYSITWSQPWRFILYHLTLLPILGFAVSIMKFFWVAGVQFIHSVFGQEWLMGEKLTRIMGWAADKLELSGWSCSTGCGHSCCDPALIPFYSNTMVLSGTETVAAVILAIFLFLLAFAVFSYGLSILSVGEVLMFIIFKKKSNDENLLEQKDEDDLEEENEEDSEDEESTEIEEEPETEDKKD